MEKINWLEKYPWTVDVNDVSKSWIEKIETDAPGWLAITEQFCSDIQSILDSNNTNILALEAEKSLGEMKIYWIVLTDTIETSVREALDARTQQYVQDSATHCSECGADTTKRFIGNELVALCDECAGKQEL